LEVSMIVRKQDGRLILISQSDHARLSGIFAAHWGNAKFARPTPTEPVVRAAAFHDCGWYEYDTGPLYDEKAADAPTFLRVPFEEVQVQAHENGIAWLTGIDPYAGLMMSRHRTGLLRGRYETVTHPSPPPQRTLGEAAAAFLARKEIEQAAAMAKVDADMFGTNFHLLQVWDMLSLYLCMTEPKPEWIEPVPVGYAGAERVRLTLTPQDAATIAIDPYPFATPSMTVSYVYRVLDRETFADQTAYRLAWFGATPQVKTFTFV
jgi:hypothetical protein